MKGSLGVLEVLVESPKDETGAPKRDKAGNFVKEFDINAGLGIDIDSIDNLISFDNISKIKLKPTFNASANLDLELTLGILSDTTSKKFPNMNTELVFAWSWKPDGEIADGVTLAGFTDITLDMGQYVSNVVVPFLSSIQKYTEPLQPMIEFLTSPVPVLKDLGFKITPLDLAAQYGHFDPGLIYAMADLIKMVNSFSGLQNGSLLAHFGKFIFIDTKNLYKDESGLVLGDASFLKHATNAAEFEEINRRSRADLDKMQSSIDKSFQDSKAPPSVKSFSNLKDFKNGKWAFPIIQDPMQALGLLMGRDADLITYDMPKLDFGFEWSQFFRIWGPLGITVGFSMDATVQLAFGYDTHGISEFIGSRYTKSSFLVDGFYIKHTPGIPELEFNGKLFAAVAVNVGIGEAGVGGGLGIVIDFNLYDPNKDNKVRLKELASSFMGEFNYGNKALAPLAIFDVSGKIYAELFAYLKIDLWFTSYTKRWQITNPITIADFSLPFTRVPDLAEELNNGDLLLNAGPDSSARMNGNTNDIDENFVVEFRDGSAWVSAPGLFGKEQKYSIKDGATLRFKGGAGHDRIGYRRGR
jgi:hypothetical protein